MNKCSPTRRKYGKVFSISMGGIPCVVIADHKVLKKCFAREEFCGSAPLGLFRRIMQVYLMNRLRLNKRGYFVSSLS
jgi:hypothetical protein